MGTPDFAATILDDIVKSGLEIVGVVTAPDRPAGRGQKLKSSPVKATSEAHKIPVLQPIKLKDPEFIQSLKSLKPDLFIVVAFRMLPEIVWSIPPFGTINLHASLLPQYRGAAPINWAIINGEKETGLTTFKIDHKIDTGRIILQEKVVLTDDMTAGDLHDILMNKGAGLITRTVDLLFSDKAELNDQNNLLESQDELKPAPKLFKENCRIDWSQSRQTIYNFIRGLSPYPGAWTVFCNQEGKEFSARVHSVSKKITDNDKPAGMIDQTNKLELVIHCESGALSINTFQPEGKKKMSAEQFLRGYRKILIKVK